MVVPWEFFLETTVAIFAIVNPVSAIPVFSGQSSGMSEQDKRAIAFKGSVACFIILTFFGLTGKLIFQIFSVTIPAFRIAGGILILFAAMDMLRGQHVRSRTSPEEEREAMTKEDISIIPLAFPLLSGPGSITTVLVLISGTKTFYHHAMIFLSILVVAILVYFVLISAGVFLRSMGPSGLKIFSRIMGLFLLTISIQFIINGITDLVPQIVKQVMEAT